MSNYEDYLALPYAVLEDARLVADGEAFRQQQAERRRR